MLAYLQTADGNDVVVAEFPDDEKAEIKTLDKDSLSSVFCGIGTKGSIKIDIKSEVSFEEHPEDKSVELVGYIIAESEDLAGRKLCVYLHETREVALSKEEGDDRVLKSKVKRIINYYKEKHGLKFSDAIEEAIETAIEKIFTEQKKKKLIKTAIVVAIVVFVVWVVSNLATEASATENNVKSEVHNILIGSEDHDG